MSIVPRTRLQFTSEPLPLTRKSFTDRNENLMPVFSSLMRSPPQSPNMYGRSCHDDGGGSLAVCACADAATQPNRIGINEVVRHCGKLLLHMVSTISFRGLMDCPIGNLTPNGAREPHPSTDTRSAAEYPIGVAEKRARKGKWSDR